MTARDAEIVKTPQELSLPSQTEFDTVQRYALVPFAYPRHQLPSLDDVKDVKFVNDLWIEKCLHHNTFIAPEKHAICTPFKSIPLSGKYDTFQDNHFRRRLLTVYQGFKVSLYARQDLPA